MSSLKTKLSQKRKETEQVINDYLRGKITVSQVRRLLQKIEGRRLIKIIDKI